MGGATRGRSRARPDRGRESPGAKIVVGRLLYTVLTLAIVGAAIWLLQKAAPPPRAWAVVAALTAGVEFETPPLNFAREDLEWLDADSRATGSLAPPKGSEPISSVDSLFSWAEGLKGSATDSESQVNADSLVVYVVAHGVSDGDGEPRLVAPDARPGDGRGKVRDLIQSLRQAPVANVILVLDCSRTLADPGRDWTGLDFADGVEKLLSEELQAEETGKLSSLAVIVSAGPGQYGVSLPGDQSRTLFGEAWRRAWSQPRPSKSPLMLTDLMLDLAKNCKQWTGGRQTPRLYVQSSDQPKRMIDVDADPDAGRLVSDRKIVVRTSPLPPEPPKDDLPREAGSTESDKKVSRRITGASSAVPAAIFSGPWLSAAFSQAAAPVLESKSDGRPAADGQEPAKAEKAGVVEPDKTTTPQTSPDSVDLPEESDVDRMWRLRDEIEASREYPMRSPVVFAPHVWRELNSRMLQQDLRFHSGAAYREDAARQIQQYASALSDLRRTLARTGGDARSSIPTAIQDVNVVKRLTLEWIGFSSSSGPLSMWEALDKQIQATARRLALERYQLRECALLAARLSRVSPEKLPTPDAFLREVMERWKEIDGILSRDEAVSPELLKELADRSSVINAPGVGQHLRAVETFRDLFKQDADAASQKERPFAARSHLEILLTSSIWSRDERQAGRAALAKPLKLETLKSPGVSAEPPSVEQTRKLIQEWHRPLYQLAGVESAPSGPKAFFEQLVSGLNADRPDEAALRHTRACLLAPEFATGVIGHVWMPCRLKVEKNRPTLELVVVDPKVPPESDKSPSLDLDKSLSEKVTLKVQWNSGSGLQLPPDVVLKLEYDSSLLRVTKTKVGEELALSGVETSFSPRELPGQRIELFVHRGKPAELKDELTTRLTVVAMAREAPDAGMIASTVKEIVIGRPARRRVELEVSPHVPRDDGAQSMRLTEAEPIQTVRLPANRTTTMRWNLKNPSPVAVRAELDLWKVSDFNAWDVASKSPRRLVATAVLEKIPDGGSLPIPWKARPADAPPAIPGSSRPAADFETMEGLICDIRLSEPLPAPSPDKPAPPSGEQTPDLATQAFQIRLEPVNPAECLDGLQRAATQERIPGNGESLTKLQIRLNAKPERLTRLPGLENTPFEMKASFDQLRTELSRSMPARLVDVTTGGSFQPPLQPVTLKTSYESSRNGRPAVVAVDVDGWPRALRYKVETIAQTGSGNEERVCELVDTPGVRIAAVRFQRHPKNAAGREFPVIDRQYGESTSLPPVKGIETLALPPQADAEPAQRLLCFPGGGDTLEVEVETDFQSDFWTAELAFGEVAQTLQRPREIRWGLASPGPDGLAIQSQVRNWIVSFNNLPGNTSEPIVLELRLLRDGERPSADRDSNTDRLRIVFDSEDPVVTIGKSFLDAVDKAAGSMNVRVSAEDRGNAASGIRRIRLAKLEARDSVPAFDKLSGMFLPDEGSSSSQRTAEFLVSELEAGKSYWFVAEATDEAGNEARSDIVSLEVPKPAVPTPTPTAKKKKDGVIRGAAIAMNGKPIDKTLEVTLEGPDGLNQVDARSGKFEFVNLDHDAKYTLTIRRFTYSQSSYADKVIKDLSPWSKDSKKADLEITVLPEK